MIRKVVSLMFLHRTFVVVMDFDQLVNIDGPFCLVLVAGSPGFEKVDVWVGLLPDKDAGNANLLFVPVSYLGILVATSSGLLTISFAEG